MDTIRLSLNAAFLLHASVTSVMLRGTLLATKVQIVSIMLLILSADNFHEFAVSSLPRRFSPCNRWNKRFLLFAHSRHTISTHETSAHRVERNSPWLTSQCSQLLIRSLPDKVLRPISSIFSRFHLINKILLCNFDSKLGTDTRKCLHECGDRQCREDGHTKMYSCSAARKSSSGK